MINNPWSPAYRRPEAPAPYYHGGPQPPHESHLRNVAIFGATLGGIGAAGFIPMRGGRVWDTYLRGIRQIEEFSPFKMFRTFRYSELFSPFGTHGPAGTFKLPSEAFTKIIERAGREIPIPNVRMRRFMAKMLGRPLHELEALGAFSKGLEFRRTGALLGQIGIVGGETLSGAALPMKAGAGATFMDWFARTSGMDIGRGGVTGLDKTAVMAITVPKVDKVLGLPLSEHAALRMQKLRLVGRYARAYWASQIGRLNRLLTAPLEMFPAAGRLMKKAGVNVAIKEGTAMQMLGRYTRKGVLIGAGFAALKYLSYLRSRAEGTVGPGLAGTAMGGLFGLLWRKSPRGAMIGAAAGLIAGVAPTFDKGLIEGTATAGVRAHMAYAGVSESLGITRAAREQEALMPGITQAKTIMGLTAGGMLAGLFTRGAARLAMLRKAGGHEALAESLTSFQEAMTAESKAATGIFGRARAGLFPAALKGQGVKARLAMTGGRLGAAAGMLAFTAFAIGASIATGGLPGILGTEKTAGELRDIYTGREEVPIKKGRWWEFGPSSYEGSRTMYDRPHAYHLMMTGARTKGLYGSEEEYWDYNPLLHPIKALFDEDFKYHWEKKYYHERPAPLTSTYFEDVPFIGPLLAATVGRMIKPPKLMHTEEWLTDEGALHVPTTGEGEPTMGLQRGTPVSPYRLDQVSGEMIYRMNELRGLTGFMHGAIKEHLTGSQDYFDEVERLEPASRAYSSAKDWYEREYGGLLSASEPIRRFIPRERRFDYYNPIGNLQPQWLPSGKSYYIDFQRGMPQTTVALGETRLPGEGYAALNPEVAGLAPSEYPLYHRFKILSDVAMWSNEYKQANQQITLAMRRGELSDIQVAKVREIRTRISERKKRRKFQQYQFSEDALEKIRVTVSQQIKPGSFETDEHGVFKLSGVKMAHDALASKNAEMIGTPNYRAKQLQVSDYLRDYIYPGAELDVYVHKDELHRYTASGQPAAMMAGGVNLGQELVGADLAEWEEESPFAAEARFGGVARGLGSLWEGLAHAEPFWEHMQPLSPMSKFIHQRSAVEEYERNRLYSRDIAMWQHPVEHFLKPAYLMATAGEGDVPEKVERQRQIEDYFDKLKWLKYRTFEITAAKTGNEEAAKEFRSMQRRTLFGVNPYGSTAFIYSALPSLDRDFFQDFADADSAGERRKILSMIPASQKPIYTAQWQNRLAKSLIAQKRMGIADTSAYAHLDALRLSKISEGRPVNPKLMAEYREEAPKDVSYADWSRIKELKDYFKSHPMPKASWVGFHPHADLEDVKLKLVEQESLDCHDFNLWQSRRRTFARKPYLEHAIENMQGGDSDPVEAMRRIESVLRDTLGLEDVQIHGNRVPGGQNFLNLEISDDRSDALFRYKNDPNYQGIL